MSDISVSIETLALDGSEAGADGGQHFARLIGAALQLLFEQQGVPAGAGGGNVADIVLPGINLPANASYEQRAQELGLVLYRALNGVM